MKITLLLLVATIAPAVSVAQSCLPTAPAKAPRIVGPGIVSAGEDESHAAFSPDGRSLYFLKNTASFSHWTIVVSNCRDDRWSTPEVAWFSGQYSDADPFLTADGKQFFFISTRPVDGKPKEDTDIWMMERTAQGWSEPRHLDAPINSSGSEWSPTLTLDGTFYFGSDRDGGRGEGGQGHTDIWRAPRVNGKYPAIENLGPQINSAAQEVEPQIAPDESFIVVAATGRPDSKGSYDLYVSCRSEQGWTPLENLGEPVNSAGWDFGPKLTPDGSRLLYTSNRDFAAQPLPRKQTYSELVRKLQAPGNGLRDIYEIDVGALRAKQSRAGGPCR